MAELTGLELLFSLVSHKFRDKLDALVATLHWLVIREQARCNIGQHILSEKLPQKWNENPNEYLLKYTKDESLYTLKVIRMDDQALVYLMKDESENVGTLSLTISEYIDKEFSCYPGSLLNTDNLLELFQKELMPILNSQKRKQLSDKCASDSRYHSTGQGTDSRYREPGTGREPYNIGAYGSRDPVDPFSVGRSDLDPFGSGQGGMLMDPLRANRQGRHPGIPGLPRGAVPPGARFDPIGPDLGRDPQRPFPPGPTPDHMKPPDFDDMFM